MEKITFEEVVEAIEDIFESINRGYYVKDEKNLKKLYESLIREFPDGSAEFLADFLINDPDWFRERGLKV